ncbi:MAG: hypothetical protein NW201_14905 [Gemmatimonadales bacterium]|nr:hypothetical protein [Gemmatimonadales bacterium]
MAGGRALLACLALLAATAACAHGRLVTLSAPPVRPWPANCAENVRLYSGARQIRVPHDTVVVLGATMRGMWVDYRAIDRVARLGANGLFIEYGDTAGAFADRGTGAMSTFLRVWQWNPPDLARRVRVYGVHVPGDSIDACVPPTPRASRVDSASSALASP